MRNKIEVQCDYCNQNYLKDESEVKRNQKLGRLSFCTLNCMGKHNTQHLEGHRGGTEHLNPRNRIDEYTPYKDYLRRVKRRHHSFDIDLQDLKDVWEQQDGICPYSKVNLIHPTIGRNSHIYTASLDRKDSSLGYVKGNIQFISIAMNHLKNSMSTDEMNEILSILRS